uniref:Uncharacterized protein n=1 Tax=viral metagenome TaxID=1070528 RepID=A0A6C0H9L1_9ZZZZ
MKTIQTIMRDISHIQKLYKKYYSEKSDVWTGILMGGCFGYMMENEYYTHLPFIIIPLPYVGFHLYKNKHFLWNEFKKNKFVFWF